MRRTCFGLIPLDFINATNIAKDIHLSQWAYAPSAVKGGKEVSGMARPWPASPALQLQLQLQ